MNIRTLKRPDGCWECWDDDEDPGPEYTGDTPHHNVGTGATKQEAVDDYCFNILGLPYSVRVA